MLHLTSNTFILSFFFHFWTALEVLLCVFLRCDQKYTCGAGGMLLRCGIPQKDTLVKASWRVLIHLNHRTWHCASSSSSPKSQWPWKVNVFSQFRTLTHNSNKTLRKEHFRKCFRKWRGWWSKGSQGKEECFEEEI